MPQELSSETKKVFHELMNRCWQIAEDHGWHEPQEMDVTIPGRFGGEKTKALVPRSVGEDIALFHSEISEALEEHRTQPLLRVYIGPSGKPEGVAVELADLVIRLMDTIKYWGMEEKFSEALEKKMNFNESRPFRHGGKKL